MKINFLIVVLIITIYSFNVNAGQIKISVSNIDEEKGTIHFGVYNDSKLFPSKDGRIIGGFEEVSKVITNGLLINDLEESDYAIAIFHDKNSNKEFDTFLAIPTEKYGFSNNAKVFLGPPKFEDASIFVGRNAFVEIIIELR
tara:strand:+ start:111 stop:536 length:426 start_codon:yes stop_codon:yes gene_type:complete